MSLRLVFMGSPAFSVPVLDALVTAGHEIACVYSQPPRPAGRGQAERPTPVHQRALALGREVRHPQSFRDPADCGAFAALKADAAVVVAYGLLLPQVILDAPRLGCFNIHASLLPRWRGAAPIHRAIMAGDAVTGVEIMQMEAGLDTGPVLARAETPIGPEDTTGDLHDRLSHLGARLMVETLPGIAAGAVAARPQTEDGVTYAAKVSPAEARIDWTRPASEVSARIRGLSPHPGAWFELHDGREPVRIKVLGARAEPCAAARAGVVLDDALLVACGEGAVRLTRLQKAGGRPLPADVFLRGQPVAPGARLT